MIVSEVLVFISSREEDRDEKLEETVTVLGGILRVAVLTKDFCIYPSEEEKQKPSRSPRHCIRGKQRRHFSKYTDKDNHN